MKDLVTKQKHFYTKWCYHYPLHHFTITFIMYRFLLWSIVKEIVLKRSKKKQITITKPVKQLDGSYFSPWIYWISENLMGFFWPAFTITTLLFIMGILYNFMLFFILVIMTEEVSITKPFPSIYKKRLSAPQNLYWHTILRVKSFHKRTESNHSLKLLSPVSLPSSDKRSHIGKCKMFRGGKKPFCLISSLKKLREEK